MALNSTLTDVSTALVQSLNAGSGGAARASLGGGSTAFAWTAGLIPTVASYATATTAEGMTFPVHRVTSTVTPATIVAPGAEKPTGTAVASGSENLAKFAGLGTFTLEDMVTAVGLANAVASVLSKQCLKAFEAHAVGVLGTAAGTPVTGTTWVSAIAAAQAQLLGEGGQPSVIVLPAADYPGFVDDILGTSAFTTSPESPLGNVLGSPVHVSSGAPAGKAYVFDSAAVLAVQHAQSPMVIADALSGADTNTLRLVIDLLAALVVVDPAAVVEVTAPV